MIQEAKAASTAAQSAAKSAQTAAASSCRAAAATAKRVRVLSNDSKHGHVGATAAGGASAGFTTENW